ncbi:hypothetical protein MLD38_025191 [Melastoma candidum]|uniref:Uncharacterized protein n=1 Tax=Melastoma candidum TaxID=119954 RepID=A0ACB9NY31_9MYRT|nr:hypothetical protein MLD38_025191 [Melastoma candidum]
MTSGGAAGWIWEEATLEELGVARSGMGRCGYGVLGAIVVGSRGVAAGHRRCYVRGWRSVAAEGRRRKDSAGTREKRRKLEGERRRRLLQQQFGCKSSFCVLLQTGASFAEWSLLRAAPRTGPAAKHQSFRFVDILDIDRSEPEQIEPLPHLVKFVLGCLGYGPKYVTALITSTMMKKKNMKSLGK